MKQIHKTLVFIMHIQYQRNLGLCPQALLQMVQSQDGSIRSVMEKGDALLSSVHYPSIRDKMHRIQKDYTALCNTAMVRL